MAEREGMSVKPGYRVVPRFGLRLEMGLLPAERWRRLFIREPEVRTFTYRLKRSALSMLSYIEEVQGRFGVLLLVRLFIVLRRAASWRDLRKGVFELLFPGEESCR